MIEKTYTLSRRVDYAYCDPRGEARLSHLLALVQQISQEHCDGAALGGDYFASRGKAFLLAKLRLDIPRTPMGGEDITLFTAPNLPYRAQYRRRTTVSTAGGELLAELDARWVLVDMASRHLLRRLPEGIVLPFLDEVPLEDFRPAPPDDLVLRETVTVRHSMVDLNLHMNNTCYGDLITNLLETRLMAGERLRSVEIFFHREALPGDSIQLWSREEGKGFFIRGVIGDLSCFEACGVLE